MTTTSKIKTVWILQTGEPVFGDEDSTRPMRALSLAAFFQSKGVKVRLITSRFYHQQKEMRIGNFYQKHDEQSELILIDSLGYTKNIGVRRLMDHCVLAWNLMRYFRSVHDIPDGIIVGYPPIETSFVAQIWAARLGIPFILDVKDQWPHIFAQGLPKSLRWLSYLIFLPQFFMGQYVMKRADCLCSITPSFLKWSQTFGKRSNCPSDFVAPLVSHTEAKHEQGEKRSDFWQSAELDISSTDKIISFVGSHSRAFDMKLVAEGLLGLGEDRSQILLVIAGSGECTERWRQIFKESGLRALFPGWLNTRQSDELYSRSTAALAPYQLSSDFLESLPNKILDAIAHGLPTIASLGSEYKRVIETYESGLQYRNRDDLTGCFREILDDQRLAQLKSNARQARDAFDSSQVMEKFLMRIDSKHV